MTIFDRLLGKGEPTPITKIFGGGSDDTFRRLGWNDPTSRREKVKRWMDRYRRGGPYADAIDSYPLFTLSPGWKLNCEEGETALMEQVQAWLDQPQIDLDHIMWQGILSSILAGDAYQEIVYTRGGGIWGVITRDPGTFEKVWDEYGKITEYRQYISAVKSFDTSIRIEPSRIINLRLFSIPGDVYGLSIWERADDDIQRDCDIIESVTKAIHRHGTPKQQWAVGTPDNPASIAEMKEIEDQIKKINSMTDFVTSNVDIRMLDTTGISNVDVYSNISLQRVACALGVPEEMLGLGRGSTEATAMVRMKGFLDKIRTIQEVVARTYTRELIDRITGVPGAVWIEFNEVDPEDEAKIAEWIAKLRTGIDPDAVVPASWARERLGIPPDKEEEDQLPGLEEGDIAPDEEV
ncbi:MAG TPA: hypothetical protein PLN56_10365 [Methanoregulaceae archaeon]|nr:hypothetical protein [Methanoregulaceae archaeon]